MVYVEGGLGELAMDNIMRQTCTSYAEEELDLGPDLDLAGRTEEDAFGQPRRERGCVAVTWLRPLFPLPIVAFSSAADTRGSDNMML